MKKNINDNKQVGYKPTKNIKNFNELILKETMYLTKEEMLDNIDNWSLAFRLDKDIISLVSKIKKNNKLGIYSAAYGDLHCILYEKPYDRERVVVTEKEYNPNIHEVLDFEGKWLKVRIKIEDKVYIGWMPPEIQCSNPYTTCS